MRIFDYTREQVETELRDIWLQEAARLFFMSGNEVECGGVLKLLPEVFLGLGSFEYDLDAEDISIDLKKFDLAQDILSEFDVLVGSKEYRHHVHVGPDLQFFFDSLPHNTWQGEVFKPGTSEGICRNIHAAYEARWKLAEYILNDNPKLLTVQQMALAANMTEGAIRNAMTSKAKNRLESVLCRGRVTIAPDVALAWLMRRRNFQPLTLTPDQSALWSTRGEEANLSFSYQCLPGLMHRLAISRFIDAEGTATATGLDLKLIEQVFSENLPDEEPFLLELGKQLGFVEDELLNVLHHNDS